MASSIPIIDSHVHLYPADEMSSHAWFTPDSPLAKQHSVADLVEAATGADRPRLGGFVYVEVDRRNGDGQDWAGPLAEVAWLRRLVTDSPREGQGHGPGDGKLCLGLVPWAPVALGAARLEEYLARAEAEAGPETWARVKGFRYLLQNKPNGTMLRDDFIDGLKALGRRGFVFDLGVDQHRRGRIQLEEAVDMIDRAHEGVPEAEKVVFVLNHLCKPDLSIVNQTDPSFIAWRTAMFTLSRCSQTYIKLSGCFSEMPDSLKAQSAEAIFAGVFPWLAVVLAAFGPSRVMFGSDWPVCTIGVDGAWEKWRTVVARMCYMATLSDEDQAMLWGGTAKKAYNLAD